jgi:SAM-dependent methyltransferase
MIILIVLYANSRYMIMTVISILHLFNLPNLLVIIVKIWNQFIKSLFLMLAAVAPINFANIQLRETIVDLGSGAGIDILLSANHVGKLGKVIGIDITDEMLKKSRRNTKDNGHIKAEFRKEDIEKRIPIEDNTVDLVISNCVINLTNTDKVSTFAEINRILKPNSGGS